tara:strand:+ start:67279 stop:67590 length:312 start_codon:yes stop_codon:yes gene_type:complete
MEPNSEEVENVGQALIILNQFHYTDEQLNVLNMFLQTYGTEYSETGFEKAFSEPESEDILNAVKALHAFTQKYQSNKIIADEIKMEFDDTLFNLNDSSNSITF